MGASVQSDVGKQVVDDYMREVNSIVATQVTANNSGTVSLNALILNQCPAAICGPPNASCVIAGNVSLNQTSAPQVVVSTQNLSTIVENTKNAIASRTQQFIQSSQGSSQGWLSTAINSQTTDQTNVQRISQLIANSISSDVITTCNNEVFSGNTAQVNLCGYIGGNFTLNQENAATVSFGCVSKQIVNLFATNTELATGIQRAEAQQAADQGGIFSFLYYIAIFFAIFVFIIIIMSVMSYFHHANKPHPVSFNDPNSPYYDPNLPPEYPPQGGYPSQGEPRYPPRPQRGYPPGHYHPQGRYPHNYRGPIPGGYSHYGASAGRYAGAAEREAAVFA